MIKKKKELKNFNFILFVLWLPKNKMAKLFETWNPFWVSALVVVIESVVPSVNNNTDHFARYRSPHIGL